MLTDAALDLSEYRLVTDEQFDGEGLARTRWLPHYLPHWSSRAATAARYDVSDGTLKLRIDADTPPWSPEFDGEVRVSHLQTGEFSGMVGSPVGQHRFRTGLVVREQQDEERLWLPHLGVIEARARAIRHPNALVAFWPIGFEDDPANSGEICIFEIFGREVGADSGLVGVGVKPQHDPRLELDFEKVRIAADLTEFHDYAVEWLPDRLRFFIDGRLVKTVEQRIAYPVQLMLDIYELPTDAPRDASAHPLVFEVAHVRDYAPR